MAEYDADAESSAELADNNQNYLIGSLVISNEMTGNSFAKCPSIIFEIVLNEIEVDADVSAYRYLEAAITNGLTITNAATGQATYHVSAASIARIIDGIEFIQNFWDGWAYNLNTGAPSFYEQFQFNSFAKLGQDYYGLNDQGIFKITGRNDNGDDINTVISTGKSTLGDDTLKTIPTIFAGARSEKEIILTVRVDENPDYSYKFIGKPNELAPIRVKIGRGLKGLFWQFELSNLDGAYIELDMINPEGTGTSRKV